jgi:hypothetical protein
VADRKVTSPFGKKADPVNYAIVRLVFLFGMVVVSALIVAFSREQVWVREVVKPE